jgi:uncharacterized membrane protein YcaP (DUF421 family)
MEKSDIHIGDWNRILFGESPPLYLLEVIVRVAIVYLMILIAIRLMGKRMSSEVSRADMVARVCLAAAVGLPIQRPGRGLLVALVIVVLIGIIGKWLARLIFYKRGMEKAFQGKHAILISDGIVDKKKTKEVHLSRERLFAALRKEGIKHLGEVKRLYIEANGEFSIVKAQQAKPGLSVVPYADDELRAAQTQTEDFVCRECGDYIGKEFSPCYCGAKECEKAVKS